MIIYTNNNNICVMNTILLHVTHNKCISMHIYHTHTSTRIIYNILFIIKIIFLSAGRI